MSPTLDEGATRDDPRVRRDHHAVTLFQALARAIDFEGLPAPHSVDLTPLRASTMQVNSLGDVDDWAARLETPTETSAHVYDTPRPWRMYSAAGALEGVEIQVWAPAYIEDGEPA